MHFKALVHLNRLVTVYAVEIEEVRCQCVNGSLLPQSSILSRHC